MVSKFKPKRRERERPSARTLVKLPVDISPGTRRYPVSSEHADTANGLPPEAPRKRKWGNWLLLAVVVVIAILSLNKGWFFAAMVNGKPVFRWQLNSAMTSRFGKQTLEGIISEILVADAAKKANVTVAQAELEARENEILKNIGDIKLEDLLAMQGMTKEDFDGQIRMQLTIEKILSPDITVAEADIDSYIASFSGQLVATDTAVRREEAKKAVFDQKMSTSFKDWFTKLKEQAKIARYL